MRAASGSTVTTFQVCLEERERSTAQVWRVCSCERCCMAQVWHGCSCEKCCGHCLEERHWSVFGFTSFKLTRLDSSALAPSLLSSSTSIFTKSLILKSATIPYRAIAIPGTDSRSSTTNTNTTRYLYWY